jgi:hypothetical protein
MNIGELYVYVIAAIIILCMFHLPTREFFKDFLRDYVKLVFAAIGLTFLLALGSTCSLDRGPEADMDWSRR